ncbi:MAG: malonate decarboxylase subunit epsilon, partial [Pusillimonas sp.]
TLFMFPGQGGQQPGMLHRLPDHPEIKRTLEDAADALATDPLALDSAQALQHSRNVQLCLLIAGVAMARRLIRAHAEPDWVTGLSIGAAPAAVISGVLSFDAALRFTDLRGRLMDAAFPHDHGMTAIIGLDTETVRSLVQQVHSSACPVYLANLNAPTQLVISGHDHAMQAVATLAQKQGATRVQRLAVTVPSHCPLFEPVARSLQQFLATCVIHRPHYHYLSSSAARRLLRPDAIASDLAGNVAQPVRWHDTARLAWEYGIRLAIEMPGGSALAGLSAPVMPDTRVISSDTTPIETLIRLTQRSSAHLP